MTWKQNASKQSVHWKSPNSPREKKRLHESLKFKAMLIVFFDIQGVGMAEWVPSGQTINQHYYTQFLTKLYEQVRRKWPGLWRNRWILHQDYGPSQNA
jgi:hypothetical protein